MLTLFDAEEPPNHTHVLWHRASKRHKWRVVGSAETGPQAFALMDTSGLKGGMWMKIDDGRDPNEKRASSVKPGGKGAA